MIVKTIKEIWEEKSCQIKSGIDLSTHNKWVCVPNCKMNDKIPPSKKMYPSTPWGYLFGVGDNWSGQYGDYKIYESIYPTEVNNDEKWIDLATGLSYSLGIKKDGSLWVCGYNWNNHLGIDTNEDDVDEWAQIGEDTDWKSIKTTMYCHFGIKTDGSLWAWGYNQNSCMGIGEELAGETILNPIQIGSDTDWVSISPTNNYNWWIWFFCIGIKEDGSLWGFGNNWDGQLGLGEEAENLIYTPTQIGSDTDWKKVSCGSWHSIAMKNDGSLWVCGSNDNWYRQIGLGEEITGVKVFTQVGSDTDWIDCDCNGTSSYALKSNGSLWGCGWNDYGELGNGNHYIDEEVELTNPNWFQLNDDTDWEKINAGGYHTCFMKKTDGSWWGAGYNKYGLLGIGNPFVSFNFTKLDYDNFNIKKINSSVWHSLFVLENPYDEIEITDDWNSNVWVAGHNWNGDLGIGDYQPQKNFIQMRNNDTWKSIDYYRYVSCGVKEDGSLWIWGGEYEDWDIEKNEKSWYGNNPTQIGSETDWKDVCIIEQSSWGDYPTIVAIKEDNTLWGFGRNQYGCLGLGHTSEVSSMTYITDNVNKVSAGLRNLLVLKNDGTLWGAGWNRWGRLGNGNTTNQSTLIQTGNSTNDWMDVCCGETHTIALKNDNTLYACGHNFYGEIGNGVPGFNVSFTTFTQIGSDTDWVKINGSDGQTIALKSNGSLWGCGSIWVYGFEGETATITQIGSDTDWIDVKSNTLYMIGMKTDSSLWGCGGTAGLGFDDFWNYRDYFEKISDDTDWEKIVVGRKSWYSKTFLLK